MSATWRLTRRHFGRQRIRAFASIGGVALALSLVLALDAIVNGVSVQITGYVDHSGADVWVAQAGVRNLHMTASWLPSTVTAEVAAVPGVAAVTPILYMTDAVAANGQRQVAYVIGVDPGATMGTPWGSTEGTPTPGPGEAVIARTFARAAGVRLGDQLTTMGHDLRIVGISGADGTIVNSIAFVSATDFVAARGGTPAVSFVLVRADPGLSPDDLATRIERSVSGVTATSREKFASEERRLVMDMAGDVVTMMNGIGFGVGLAVVALIVYVATVSRRREYGVLKAIGARNRLLYGLVLAQAGLAVLLAFGLAVAVTAGLGAVVAIAGVPLSLSIAPESLVKVAAFATVIAGLASIVPVRQVAGIDPAIVFSRGGAR